LLARLKVIRLKEVFPHFPKEKAALRDDLLNHG
jgi:hypothetical protein